MGPKYDSVQQSHQAILFHSLQRGPTTKINNPYEQFEASTAWTLEFSELIP